MDNLTANNLFDKAFPNQRIDCEMLKNKKFEKDIKNILANEKILDYRCYLKRSKQVIYYVAETKIAYITYKENLKTKEQEAYYIEKEKLL